ncbi:MAG TPA: biotin/lipoyl-binding protein, partial [Gammaproteobacteria bacterium]|nr:biotin/lipoyl-binding protein [Gammaproteobacteria bacterium]
MTKRKVLIIISAAVVVLLAVLVVHRLLVARHRREFAATGLQVKMLDRGPVTLLVKSSGTLNPVVLVDVGTQVSGILLHLYVDYNTPVKKGQTLAELDPTLFLSQLHQDEAALTSAQTNLAIARKSDQRLAGLLPSGFVAQSDVDTADDTLAAAEAQVQT